MDIQEHIPLAPLTTLQVGGSARFFVRAATTHDVEESLDFATSRDLPVFVLGGGSNVLISDNGWPGLVLQIGILGIAEEQAARFSVGAGEDWDRFVAQVVEKNYAGVECLSGIPGSVGGTPVQNVGAYGQEVSETIVSVLAFHRQGNRVRDLSPADCGFSYRASIFNTSQRGRYIILRVTYALRAGGAPNLRYGDLQKYFAGRDRTPSLSEVRDAVLKIRASKGMVISRGDPDSRSAGSFFKNPVLSASQFDDLERRAKARNLQVPSYPALAHQHKVSAAWLVEQSEFPKGYVKGNTGISNKHALALINRGGASAAEIVGLQQEIQTRVESAWGIRLETEPVFVGF
ncbi:MAG TPA: UDP-N-acetylmuramate dehydrogenase [Terriglobales bacterium]|nr:UDP-N-acetylmuramate dehydrogenase [Terriglobales bacterium]